jgi:hypothetical protein
MGATLACLLFFRIPRRRRNYSAILGMLGLLVLLTGGMLGCGGSGGGGGGTTTSTPGTTAGVYTVTVTCASAGSILSTGTLTVKVQ